jgi:hypothetical protein
MTDLTIKEAYLAMYQFMNTVIRRDGNESFLYMIGGMSLIHDGSTADPGMWYLWERAIKRINMDLADHLTIEEAHAAMRSFLEHWNSLGHPEEDMTRILSLVNPRPGEFLDKNLWADWMDTVRAAKANEVDAALRLQKR